MGRDRKMTRHLLVATFHIMQEWAAHVRGASRLAPCCAVLLAGLLLLPMGAAHAASFDCATAVTPGEKTICDNRGLNDQDVKMATLYEVLTQLVAMGQRGELQDAQRSWLKGRAQCKGDIACLRTAYESRIHTLQQALQGIYSRGPY